MCPRWMWSCSGESFYLQHHPKIIPKIILTFLCQGTEVCNDKVQTIVQDVPKEQCTLEPQRTCKHVTKLVPKLEPTEECVDVPKEVCTRSRTNPRPVKKPVQKKWCYVPTEESGLA